MQKTQKRTLKANYIVVPKINTEISISLSLLIFILKSDFFFF